MAINAPLYRSLIGNIYSINAEPNNVLIIFPLEIRLVPELLLCYVGHS